MSVRVQRAYADGRYGQLHYRIARPAMPTARPLVCFHLSPVSGVVFERFMAEMGRERLCVAPDTPGYGQSDPPPTQPTIGDYAAAHGELLDALGLGEVDLLGYHTGSKIAVELALQRPVQVRHLVLIAAPVYTPAELEAMRRSHGNLEPVDDGSHLADYWRTLLRWRGPGQTPEMLMEWMPDSIRGGARRAFGHRAAFDWQYPDHLPRVSQPVLVLDPDDDLHPYTGRVRDYLRNGRVLPLPGRGHGFLDRQATEAAAIIRDWTAGSAGG